MMKLSGFGRLVSDPILKPVGETFVCEFTLAVDEHRKIAGERVKKTNFFDFVIWDKAAEVVCQYKKKGDLLYVDATPRQDKWTDKDGASKSRVVFRVNEFSFLPSIKVTE